MKTFWKTMGWLTLYFSVLLLNLYAFVHASLDKKYFWAAVDWAFVMLFTLYCLAHGYRLHVMYRWRHRHDT